MIPTDPVAHKHAYLRNMNRGISSIQICANRMGTVVYPLQTFYNLKEIEKKAKKKQTVTKNTYAINKSEFKTK